MLEISHTPELFIFDTVTQLGVMIISLLIFIRTRSMYSLSLQKGLKFLSNAMLLYVFSFGLRYITTLFDYFDGGLYYSFNFTTLGLVFMFVNLWLALLGAFYLAYSLMWRKFEKDSVKHFHFHKVIGLNIFIVILIAIDIFLMIRYKVDVPYLFFISSILILLKAIKSNYVHCCRIGMKSEHMSPFISLVALGLGIYVAFLIENLLDQMFFTIHYYIWGIVVVLSLTFLYHVYRIIK